MGQWGTILIQTVTRKIFFLFFLFFFLAYSFSDLRPWLFNSLLSLCWVEHWSERALLSKGHCLMVSRSGEKDKDWVTGRYQRQVIPLQRMPPLTQILWRTHFKLFLLKHFVHSYLNPSIEKLGFILDQEVPASTKIPLCDILNQEIMLIKMILGLYVPLSKDHIFPYH